MATTDFLPPRADLPTAGMAGPSVAEDMAAIFGSPLREPPVDASQSAPPVGRVRSRAGVGAVAAGLILATVAAGVFAGRTVPTSPTAATAAPVHRAVERSAPREPAAEVAAVMPPAEPVAVLPRADDTPPPSSSSSASSSEPMPVPPPVRVVTTTRTSYPPGAPPAAEPRPPVARAEPVAPPVAVQRGNSCDDDACIADRIYSADRSVADAFDAATAAGVDRRMLRGYQREWDRARGEADDRPGETLRLYGMIRSDLRNLARAAAPENGEPR